MKVEADPTSHLPIFTASPGRAPGEGFGVTACDYTGALAAGLLLGHRLVMLLVLGPALRGLAFGGVGALLAVVAQVRVGVAWGEPHQAGSMAFHRSSVNRVPQPAHTGRPASRSASCCAAMRRSSSLRSRWRVAYSACLRASWASRRVTDRLKERLVVRVHSAACLPHAVRPRLLRPVCPVVVRTHRVHASASSLLGVAGRAGAGAVGRLWEAASPLWSRY